MSSAKPFFSSSDALAMMEASLAASKQAMEKMVQTGSQAGDASLSQYSTLMAVSKEHADALVQSGNQWVNGMKDLGEEASTLAQQRLDTLVEHGKTAMTAKSVRHLMTLQREFTQSHIGQAVSDSTRLSEKGIKVAEQAAQPLHDQIQQAFASFFNKP